MFCKINWVIGLCLIALFGAFGEATAQNGEMREFLVDAKGSEVTILLFREGLFSGFAHDHVLVSKNLSGRVLIDPNDDHRIIVQLTLPVVSIEVDRPEHRRREKLPLNISEADREEVRETMLGEDQLHGGKYPRIELTSDRVEGAWPELTLWANLRIKGKEITLPIMVKATLDGPMLLVSGTFELKQSDFGIEPFSTFLATVAVQDRVRVRFVIRAREDR